MEIWKIKWCLSVSLVTWEWYVCVLCTVLPLPSNYYYMVPAYELGGYDSEKGYLYAHFLRTVDTESTLLTCFSEYFHKVKPTISAVRFVEISKNKQSSICMGGYLPSQNFPSLHPGTYLLLLLEWERVCMKTRIGICGLNNVNYGRWGFYHRSSWEIFFVFLND